MSGALERPLHHSERVLETVARWGYWDPEDRKDNVLILKKDQLYKDIAPLVKELKYQRKLFLNNSLSSISSPVSVLRSNLNIHYLIKTSSGT